MTSQYEVFGETLKGKLLEDILELKDIKALDYYMTRIITDNFREPYVRLLVSKLPTLEEQTEYVEWIYEEINSDDDMPWCEQSYLVYLLDLRLQLKGKRKELEPSPQVLGAAYAAKLLKEDIIGICGEWVLVDDDFSAFAYNWVEGYRYNPYPWEWKDKLRDVWEQEWCDMNIFDDLMRMIANNTATMYINEKEVDEVIKNRVENVLFSELKAPTEPHANKRKFIIDSFAKYFYAPSLPQPEEAVAELQSRCDTLTAENTELKMRCAELRGELQAMRDAERLKQENSKPVQENSATTAAPPCAGRQADGSLTATTALKARIDSVKPLLNCKRKWFVVCKYMMWKGIVPDCDFDAAKTAINRIYPDVDFDTHDFATKMNVQSFSRPHTEWKLGDGPLRDRRTFNQYLHIATLLLNDNP